MDINDSGKRISYGDGKAIREPSDGKGRYDLITPFGLRRLALWYELGAKKYSDRNWEKGIPYSRCIDSAKRHIDKFIMGMDDEDHLAAAVWNLMAIMHYQELGQTELDDMPHYLTDISEESDDEPNTEFVYMCRRCGSCFYLNRNDPTDCLVDHLADKHGVHPMPDQERVTFIRNNYRNYEKENNHE